jgi:hypothetical protein
LRLNWDGALGSSPEPLYLLRMKFRKVTSCCSAHNTASHRKVTNVVFKRLEHGRRVFIVSILHIDKETSLAETLCRAGMPLYATMALDRRGDDLEGTIMKDVWQSVPGTRFFSRNGEGLYERLTDQLYLRVDEVDETDAREVCTRFAEAFEARAPVCMVA